MCSALVAVHLRSTLVRNQLDKDSSPHTVTMAQGHQRLDRQLPGLIAVQARPCVCCDCTQVEQRERLVCVTTMQPAVCLLVVTPRPLSGWRCCCGTRHGANTSTDIRLCNTCCALCYLQASPASARSAAGMRVPSLPCLLAQRPTPRQQTPATLASCCTPRSGAAPTPWTCVSTRMCGACRWRRPWACAPTCWQTPWDAPGCCRCVGVL
jgi:hypothetical protein